MELNKITFYAIEKAIKSYRMMAQRNLKSAGIPLTIDQWLVLKALIENENATQNEIGIIVFKDAASVTRIIENLVNNKYLNRISYPNDRRKFKLTLTEKALETLKIMQPIIENNRKIALENIDNNSLKILYESLLTISKNCSK